MKKLFVLNLIILVVAISTLAQAGSINRWQIFQTDESGSFIAQGTPIDTNGDFRTADQVLTNGKSALLGSTNTQSVIEWQSEFSLRPDFCPDGFGSNLISGSSVIRTDKGLLFVQFTDDSTNCFHYFTDGIGKIILNGKIIGGTSYYKNAEGIICVTATVYPVEVLESGDVVFGGVESRAVGKLKK